MESFPFVQSFYRNDHLLGAVAMPNWCEATVVGKTIWTEGLFTLTVVADGLTPHQPGQFLHLALRQPTDDAPDRIINRPYSVASPAGKEIEFFIVVVPDGQLTPQLWLLEVGDSLLVSDKGAGRFTLAHSPKSETLWLMSTGTGLAPYIAMLRDGSVWDDYEKIAVVHGVRHAADLAYADELRGFEAQFPGRFAYVPALTREAMAGTLSGRLPKLLADGQIEQQIGWTLEQSNSTVLLCGNPAMLNDMESLLEQRNMKQHRKKSPGQIVFERYW